MKRILKLKASNGIQSRQLGSSFALYGKHGVYPWRKMGKDILINAPPAGVDDHPWKTRIKWYDNMKTYGGVATSGFGAIINPGFVNGIDPVAVSAYSDSSMLADVERQGIFRKSPGLLDSPVIPLIDLTESGEFVAETFAPVVTDEGTLSPEQRAFGTKEGSVLNPANLSTVLTSVELPKVIREIAMINKSRMMITWIYVRMAINTSVTMPVAPNLAHFALLSSGLIGAMTAATVEGMRVGLPKSITNTGGPTTSIWRDRAQIAVGYSGLFGRETIFTAYPIAEVYLIIPEGSSGSLAGFGAGAAGAIPYVRQLCYWNLQFRVNRAQGSSSSDDSGKYQWFV